MKGIPEKGTSSDWKIHNQEKLTRFIQMAKVQEINQWLEKCLGQQLFNLNRCEDRFLNVN